MSGLRITFLLALATAILLCRGNVFDPDGPGVEADLPAGSESGGPDASDSSGADDAPAGLTASTDPCSNLTVRSATLAAHQSGAGAGRLYAGEIFRPPIS